MTVTFICPGLGHLQNIFTLLFSFATQKALWDALFIYMDFLLFHILNSKIIIFSTIIAKVWKLN